MKKEKNGFTLMEMLAVILIVGIVTLISIPIINNVIKESRLGAFRTSILSLFEAYTNYKVKHESEIKEKISIFELDITNKETFTKGQISNKENFIKIENVSNGIYCASGTQDNLKIVEGTCDLLDETPPEIVSVTTDVTTNAIKVYTSYQEEESYIAKHEYRISKGNKNIEEKEWISGDTLTENLSTKTFSNLEQGGFYRIQIRLTNTALENNISKVYEIEVTTLTLEKPVITLLTEEEYATSKEVKITYPEGSGLIYEYSLEEEWILVSEKEKNIIMEDNRTVRARVYDGVNYVYADFLAISGIDKTKPVVELIKKEEENKSFLGVKVEPTLTLSGYTYTWYKDGKILENVHSDTLENITSGRYKVKVKTGAGLEAETKEVDIQFYTITFIENGATLSNKTESCVIMDREESCTVVTPEIIREGYTILGYGESKDSKVAIIGSDAILTVKENKTYYAVTSKILTASFNKNTVSSISATSSNCMIYNTETSCALSLPTITPQTGFVNNGWGTSAGQTSNGVTSITLDASNTGRTWYALNSRVLTWNFNKGSVSSISKTTDGCTIWNTSATCIISAPTIKPVGGYTQNGFGTSNTATSATVAQSGTITLSNTSTGGTYYGLQKRTITISYNGNGATSGSTATQTCTMYNASTTCAVTLNANGFTRTNYTFQGYGTGTSSVSHSAGTNYSFSNNTSLYAIWKSKGESLPNKISGLPGLIDAGGGKRYTGKNPNNYILFNRELWRIIGVFDGKTKIIINTSLGAMSWNTTKKNDWKSSSLYSYLNGAYYNSLNATYKDMVENATWRIGGSSTNSITTNSMYINEGSVLGKGSTSLTATGYVGLINASDFGYASSSCWGGTNLYNYNGTTCKNTNWLVPEQNEWTITTRSSSASNVFYIQTGGSCTASGIVTTARKFRPVLYLKTNIKIVSGTGTSSDPYTISQ